MNKIRVAALVRRVGFILIFVFTVTALFLCAVALAQHPDRGETFFSTVLLLSLLVLLGAQFGLLLEEEATVITREPQKSVPSDPPPMLLAKSARPSVPEWLNRWEDVFVKETQTLVRDARPQKIYELHRRGCPVFCIMASKRLAAVSDEYRMFLAARG